MAISKNEKVALWVSGAIGIIVLAWMVWMRRQSSGPAPTSNSPGYIGLAYPGNQPWTISANGLPAVPSDDSGNCNSCSKGNGMFTGIGDMLNYYMSKSKDIFNSYQQRVYAAYPDSVTQYFNNPAGAAQSASARQVFGGMNIKAF
jgi:hypothetical protein